MLAQAATNDRSQDLSKKQSAWAKPHSVLENLQGSVEKLSLTLNALQGSVELLQPTTKDFTRLKHVMHFQRQYDLVSEKDIKSAQSQIAQDIRPQIDTLLSEAEAVMAKLHSEEQTLEAAVEKQEEELKHQQLRVNEKQRLENLHHRAGDEDRSKIDQASAETMRRLKSLKLKKDGLIRTIEDRAEEIEKKEHQLYKLKQDTKRMQQRRQNAASDGAAQESQYELRKRQLTAELASVELKLNQKKKLIQSKRRSTIGSIGDGILSDSKKSRRRKLVEADLDNTLGNDELHWKFYPQHLRFIQDVLERICNSSYHGDQQLLEEYERQARSYLQQIQKDRTTISTVTQTDRKQWKRHSIKQMKTMCKILFPEGTVGTTMGRIIEMLFSDEPTIKKDGHKSEEDDFMIDILERGVPVKVLAREFPPAQERRHNLQKAIHILSDVGVIETLQEVDESDDTSPGEMIIRVKGVESIYEE
ncbi:unnamed protein product [Umbelopsis ramanniana]